MQMHAGSSRASGWWNAHEISMKEQFRKDVEAGLSDPQKRLPSKYFYDAVGDGLFVEIMQLPEYYLTRAEMAIFSEQTDELISALGLSTATPFELVELGAGDGTKTKKLLSRLLDKGFRFTYEPIDISKDALNGLEVALREELPQLQVSPRQGDYFKVLKDLSVSETDKVVLFLGSNLGNMTDETARSFFQQLGDSLRPGDRVLLGLDLIKPASVVIPAYSDSQGVTARFNLNVLKRINRELGGEFNTSKFRHLVEYTQEEGIVRSYLESTEDQTVAVKALGRSFRFGKGERIHTEVSRKYDDAVLVRILSGSQFGIEARITDPEGLFADYVLRRHEQR